MPLATRTLSAVEAAWSCRGPSCSPLTRALQLQPFGGSRHPDRSRQSRGLVKEVGPPEGFTNTAQLGQDGKRRAIRINERVGDVIENRCYLLGAGFSKAISDSMPVMTDLAEMVMPQLDMTIEELAPFGHDLEQWLSFLANPQPWLAESQNLKNRAIFLDASQAIYTTIRSAEERALQVACPSWLRGLVDELSDVKASVLTFNYDLLLERAALTAGRAKSFSELYVAPVLDRRRPGTARWLSVGQSDRSVFELYKLHGSTNWLTQASSSVGTSSGLFTDQDRGFWSGGGGRTDSPQARYSDLSRMVVPPVSTKDSFYANDALNAQWKMAANRLSECVELVICGYSFPATDYSTRALIRTKLSDAARVIVIDPTDDVFERVFNLLGGTGRELQRFRSIEATSMSWAHTWWSGERFAMTTERFTRASRWMAFS